MHLRREMILFLNAERGARDVHVVGGELIDRIVIAAFLEGGLHAENLTEIGDFLGLADPADGGCNGEGLIIVIRGSDTVKTRLAGDHF